MRFERWAMTTGLVFTSFMIIAQAAHPYVVESPIEVPLLFDDGQIRTTNGISFSPDGLVLYISLSMDDRFENGKQKAGIFTYHFVEGIWEGPSQLKLGRKMDAYHPVISMDGRFLYFNSRSGSADPDQEIKHDIWFMQQSNGSWSEPQGIEEINSNDYESYPSVARNGNLYFNSDRPGGQGGMDIYISRYVDGFYTQPENIKEINSPDAENDLVVDPDERFLIFNRYHAETNEIELYISVKEDQSWTTPTPIDSINRPGKWELTPTLSPDGRYFFYELDSKIMQVDLGVVVGALVD